ncbi:hypothetical protein ACFTXB_13565 [Streptomyces sp. NPDC057074]|uniref:hypothetical protein n=1 Tax=Streptomyces sp. NPDC057074 TaxID=3346015 RepID=UPI00363C35FB
MRRAQARLPAPDLLGEFASGIAADGTVVEKGYPGSVKVLGEGVDTKYCDSVYVADARGSVPGLVEAVGRALRMRPGEGQAASLVVPVLLGPARRPTPCSLRARWPASAASPHWRSTAFAACVTASTGTRGPRSPRGPEDPVGRPPFRSSPCASTPYG